MAGRFRLIIMIYFSTCLCFAGCAKGEKVKPDGLLKEDSPMDRKPILAGSWYPGSAVALTEEIESYVKASDVPQIEGRIVGLISPHAGYVYSGPVAAFGCKALMDNKSQYKGSTFVIIGPNHRARGFNDISIWAEGAWTTPLGSTPIDTKLANALIDELSPLASFNRQAHEVEHSIEIQLPFLQYALDNDLKIVPIMVGSQSDNIINKLAAALAKYADERTIIVASTDLSHYHPEREAHELDGFFVDAVLSGDADSLHDVVRLGKCEACGYAPVLALMRAAGALGADTVFKLQYATSADVPAGDSTQVVGYFSALFLDTGSDMKLKSYEESASGGQNDPDVDFDLTDDQKIYLLELARTTIEKYVRDGEIYAPAPPEDKLLREDGAVFVTLHEQGQLRGCIGQMIAQGPLYKAVLEMAVSAAVRDHRFRPVSKEELDEIDIEISVLSPMQPIDDWQKIEIGKHGVWMVKDNRSGVFLPQVGRETGWSLVEFLEELSSQKAGLSRNAYKDPSTQLFVFTVVEFDEHGFGIK